MGWEHKQNNMIDALSDLALIWAAVFVAVVAARKTRLTPVLFFLFMGCVLVNFGILPHDPHPFIRGFSELGIIIIMFALGYEEKVSNFLLGIRRSWGIATFGAIAPFSAAYFITYHFWQDADLALMCGLAMTATAVSLTMVSLKSEGLAASPVATRIMTSAVLDDIASLALVAIVVPVVTGEQAPGLLTIGVILAKAIGFFVLVTFVGAFVLPHNPGGIVGRLPIIRHVAARQLLSFGNGEYTTLTVLSMALVLGLVAHAFGFHPAVGAYMAGLILKEEYFQQDVNRNSYFETKRIVDNAAFAWIGPVFFVQLGGHLVFDWDIFVSVIPQSLALVTGLFFAQVTSASLAARFTGGMGWADSVMIGFGMLGRAELAFVVIDIAYVQHSIINTEAFYTLMITAFWLNVLVPLTINWWRPRCQVNQTPAPLAGESGPS